MHASHSRLIGLVVSLFAAGCGGDAVGEPLIATTLVGEYDGVEFIPINGYATVYDGNSIIVLGTGPIACGSEDDSLPPRGHTAAMRINALAEGSYGNVQVQLYSNVGQFMGSGSNSGSVTISSVTDDSVVGEVTYNYTDAQDREYSITGTFEVAHCAY